MVMAISWVVTLGTHDGGLHFSCNEIKRLEDDDKWKFFKFQKFFKLEGAYLCNLWETRFSLHPIVMETFKGVLVTGIFGIRFCHVLRGLE